MRGVLACAARLIAGAWRCWTCRCWNWRCGAMRAAAAGALRKAGAALATGAVLAAGAARAAGAAGAAGAPKRAAGCADATYGIAVVSIKSAAKPAIVFVMSSCLSLTRLDEPTAEADGSFARFRKIETS